MKYIRLVDSSLGDNNPLTDPVLKKDTVPSLGSAGWVPRSNNSASSYLAALTRMRKFHFLVIL